MASSKINIDLVLNTKGFRPLGRINGQLGEFEKSLDASNARVLAFGASAGAILAVRKALTATVKAAIEVEKSLKDINVILQATSVNLKKFGSDLFDIASQTGQSFQIAAQAAAELARQGLGTEETLKRTRAALILARLSGMGAAEAVNSLTAAINTFNKAGLDSTTIINKLANVDAAFAVSSDDLAKALGRVGSSAKGAGVSLDELLAIVTTVQQKTARGGAVIGNSFKTIFTRIQRPRVIKELENLGVAVRDVQGDVLPAIKVLNNLAKQFDNLSQSQRSQISELVGGVFQVNILKAAMSDLSKETSIYNRALGISLGSSDQAIKRNEELNKTLAAQFNRTVNTFKEGAAELGQLTFGPALERLFGIVEGFEKLGETDGGKIGGAIAKSIFEGIGNFIAGPGLLIIGYTLFKTFSQLGKFAADAFKTLTGLNKNFQTQLNLQKQIFNVLEENPDLMRRIKDGAISVEDAHREIYSQISKNTDALEEQLRMSQRLAQGLSGSGVGFSPDFGAFTGGSKPKFGASGGYAPNFADEVGGMIASGYSRSQIRNPKVKRQKVHDGRGGSFNATINGYEDVINTRNSMGRKATFVVPPRNTDAYKEYMSSLSGGFVPNFAQNLKSFLGKSFGSKKDLLSQIESGVAAGQLRANPVIDGRDYSFGRVSAEEINAARAAGKKIKDQGLVDLRNKKLKGDAVTGQGKNIDTKTKESKEIRVYDAKKAIGALALYGTNSDRGYIELDSSKIKFNRKSLSKEQLAGFYKKVAFKNVQFRSIGGSLDDKDREGWFSQELRSQFSQPMQDLASAFSKKLLKNKAISPNISGNGRPLFSVSAEGNIFETVVNALTSGSSSAFEDALGGDEQQTWDFSGAGKDFMDYFDFDGKLKQADAKRTLNDSGTDSIVKKIYATPASGFGQSSKAYITDIKRAIAGSKASGFIPNFNALHEAVRRERDAGVPSGRIRLGQSDRLRNSANPAGLGIYNTRDEPMGLSQGINNSIAAGVDPKRQGRAAGYVPNFSDNLPAVRPTLDLDTLETSLVNTFTTAFKAGEKAFSEKFFKSAKDAGMKYAGHDPGLASGSGGGGGGNRYTPPIIDTDDLNERKPKLLTGSGSGSGRKHSATAENTRAVKENTNSAMKTMLIMGLVEQAASGLNNAVSENNTVAKSLTNSIATLVGTAVALRYALSEYNQSRGITAARGTPEFGTQLTAARRRRQTSIISMGERLGTYGMNLQSDNIGKKGIRAGAKRFAGASLAGAGARIGGLGAGRVGRFVGGGGPAAIGGAAVAGLAVGKVLGDLFTNSDYDETFKEARLAAKEFEKVREATEKNIGALDKFSNATQNVTDVFNNANSTVTEMLTATKAVEKELAKLPAKYQKQLAGVINPKIIAGMVQQFQQQERDLADAAQKRKFAADTVRGGRTSGAAEFFSSPLQSVLNKVAGNDILGRSEEDLNVIRQDLKTVGSDFVQASINRQGISSFRESDLSSDLKSLSRIDESNVDARVQRAGEILNLDPEKDAKAFASLRNIFQEGGFVAQEFINGLSKSALETQQSLKIREKMRPELEAFAKANREATMRVNKMKRTMESELKTRKAVMEITSKAAKAFLTEVGSIKLDNINKISEITADANTKFGGTVQEVQTSLGQTDGALGADVEKSVSALLDKAARGGVGSVKASEAQREADKIQARMDELRSKEGKTEDQIAEDTAQADLLEGTKIAVENLGGTSERMKEELQLQTKEINEQTKAQIEAARQAQRLRSFGGTQALLDPSKLNAQFSQIRASGQAELTSRMAGSRVGVGRARINRFAAIQDLAGGELPEHMRGRARQEAFGVALNDTRLMNRALGLGMSEKDIRKTASEKASNLFKGDPQEQNTKELRSLNETLKSGIELKTQSLEDQLKINKQQQEDAQKRFKTGNTLRSRVRGYRESMQSLTDQDLEEIEAQAEVAGEGRTEAEKANFKVAGAAIGAGVGTYGGMKAGAALGASLGSVVPGLGTAIGGVVGAVGGAALGYFIGSGVSNIGDEADAGEVQRAGEKVRNANRGEREDAQRQIQDLDRQKVVTNNNDFSSVDQSHHTDSSTTNVYLSGPGSQFAQADVDSIVKESESMDDLLTRVNNLEAVVDTTALNQQPPSRMS